MTCVKLKLIQQNIKVITTWANLWQVEEGKQAQGALFFVDDEAASGPGCCTYGEQSMHNPN